MNFQPSDYLNNLNLVFDNAVVSPVEENINKADLDVFQQTEFFDFDVFFDGADKGLPQKSVVVKEENPEGVAHWAPSNGHNGLDAAHVQSDVSSVNTPRFLTENSLESFEMKRKRNTAASARFRIKKKQKELQMQQHAKELQDKLSLYEKKLRSLEMENKCLKQLISEKNNKKHCDLLDSIKKRSLGDSNASSTFNFTN